MLKIPPEQITETGLRLKRLVEAAIPIATSEYGEKPDGYCFRYDFSYSDDATLPRFMFLFVTPDDFNRTKSWVSGINIYWQDIDRHNTDLSSYVLNLVRNAVAELKPLKLQHFGI